MQLVAPGGEYVPAEHEALTPSLQKVPGGHILHPLVNLYFRLLKETE